MHIACLKTKYSKNLQAIEHCLSQLSSINLIIGEFTIILVILDY